MTDTKNSAVLVRDIGEDELIDRFAPLLGDGGALVPVGDDAAVVALRDPRVVVSTDALVERAHFRRDWSSGADVGWRAVMQNAPDVAAMGAHPVGFVVSLVIPADTEVDWVLDLARGMQEASDAVAEVTGRPCGVVGGDLASGPNVVVAMTAFGDLGERDPVRRGTAREGDVLAHAGTLGRSAAGFSLLDAGRDGDLPAALSLEAAAAIRTFRRPTPPLEAALRAADMGAHAMMDVSDGLLRDAARMARQAGLALDVVHPERLVDDVVATVAAELEADPVRWILAGGEDHGFLAAFGPDVALPAGFTEVGRFAAGSGVSVEGASPEDLGWDHFRR